MVAPASLACLSWVPSWAPSMAPTMMTLSPLVTMALIWFCCSETPPLANCTSGLKPALREAVVEQLLRQDPVFTGLLGERDADRGALRERLAARAEPPDGRVGTAAAL